MRELTAEQKALLEKVADAIADGRVKHDVNWRYPQQGDDPKSCPLLAAMLEIEYHSGTLIWIPDSENAATFRGI